MILKNLIMEQPSKAAKLRALITSGQLEFVMEAHDGISAKIVEESMFKGIWASGLTISAALGVRDNNEASWTQVLEVLEFMADATSILILVDGDTGYGNFNNVRTVPWGTAAKDVEDALTTSRKSVRRGRPSLFGGGMWGESQRHSASVKSLA